MKISFIIPVYKVEQYLRQCVESLTSQTYKDIEIILVDDGSPDGSPALCDKLEKEDARIRVIHKENGGLSDARNTGLKTTTGDFVVFVDGDDFWINKDALERLVGIAETNKDLDFIGFNCKYYFPREGVFSEWLQFPKSLGEPVDKNIALSRLAKAGIFPVSACMKFIKRDFLFRNDLFFVVGQLSEDIPWFINLINACNKCVFLNDYIYAYRQVLNGTSITHNVGIKNVDSLISIINKEIAIMPERSFSKDAKEALMSFLAYELIQAYTCIPNLSKKEARNKNRELHKLNWLFSYTQNPKVKTVNKVRKLLGIRLTVFFINYYVKHRR